jgi:hypothetical protein
MTIDTGKITGAADDLSDKLTKGGSAAKTLGVEIASTLNSLDARIAKLESAQPPTTGTAMDEAVRLNTVGQSEAFPAGVPHENTWYVGKSVGGQPVCPSNYVAVNGWNVLYPEEGQGLVPGNCMIRNYATWILSKSGVWTCVQDQAKGQHIEGSHFPANFDGPTIPWTFTNNADGSCTGNAPPTGYNNHYWPAGRGTFPAGTVAGVFTMVETKVTSASMRFVVAIGADWWPAATGGLPDGSYSNPGVGTCNWIKLTTDWRWSYFYSLTTDQIKANPPPPLR